MSDTNQRRFWTPPTMERRAFAELGAAFSRASAAFQEACADAEDPRLRMARELLRIVDYQVLRYLRDAVDLTDPDDGRSAP